MTRRRNSIFDRMRGPSSVSYQGELQKRRAETRKRKQEQKHQDRLEAQRQREREREELRREREQIREANALKRQLLKEERAERKAETAQREQERAERATPSAAAIKRAYDRGAKSLTEAMEMARSNPRGKKGDFARCVKAVSKRKGAKDPEAICAAQERKRGLINPAEAAAEAYEIFHGRKPEEFVTIAKQRHYHKHLAACGELEALVIVTPDKKNRVTLSKFDGALLAFNEQALKELAKKGKVKLTQLFIEGGDQTVNLEDFGIDPDNVHELETLGKAVKIDYFTTKDHLGSEGGTAVYAHKFRTTNNNGRHQTVRIAKYPDVIYRVRDNQLELSGGSYEIRAEGIDL